MTGWSREIIDGKTVYVIHVDSGDLMGASNVVYQLLPTLQTGEEIRIRPAVKPLEIEPHKPWGIGHSRPLESNL